MNTGLTSVVRPLLLTCWSILHFFLFVMTENNQGVRKKSGIKCLLLYNIMRLFCFVLQLYLKNVGALSKKMVKKESLACIKTDPHTQVK